MTSALSSFTLRAAAPARRFIAASCIPALSSPAAATAVSLSATAARSRLRFCPASAASSFSSSVSNRCFSTSATSFQEKKQREWRIRDSRSYAWMKTHAGTKKRIRFVGRFTVICKHTGKVHKNYHKRGTRLRRLRPMKIVPRHLVPTLKIMMPYWKRQMRKEQQLLKINTETSVNTTSNVSYERQKQFIEEQNKRLRQQLLHPTSYFAQSAAAAAATPATVAQ